MLTMNMTPEEDRELVLIVRINLDTEYMYFSDTVDQITLSGTAFDGKIISKDSISEATKDVDVTSGGTMGQVGNWKLSLARYTTYTGPITTFNDFFNDFAPATSKPLLTSKTVDVGVVWGGAVDLAEITWLYQFYIETYDWTTSQLNLGCIEYDELVATQLPYYVIQDEIDNGISYFTNAPEESYGQTIPIIYGEFYTENLEYSDYLVSPTIRTHKTDNNFIMSSHICFLVDSTYLFKYLDGAKTLMRLNGATYSATNARRGYIISLSTNGSVIYGDLFLQFGASINGGLFTGITDECMDKDSTTYSVVTAGTRIGLKLISTLNDSDLGMIPFTWDKVVFRPRFRSVSGTVTGNMQWYNPYINNNDVNKLSETAVGNFAAFSITTTETLEAFGFGIDFASQRWSIEDLQNIYCCLTNMDGNLRLINAHLEITDIEVYDQTAITLGMAWESFDRRYLDAAVPQTTARSIMANYGAEISRKNFNKINSAMYAKVKGYMYDNWID